MLKTFLILPLFFLSILMQGHPSVYVKVRPSHPNVVVVRPACPSQKHIWVDGEWGWNPNLRNYEWKEGRWEMPQPYAKWIPGHWKQTKQGYNWIAGHWKQIR